MPPGDVAEQRRRNELIRYAIISPWDCVLISLQEARGHRGTVTIVLREAAATC